MPSNKMQNITLWPITMASHAEFLAGLAACKIILHNQQSRLEHHHPEGIYTA
jgi:hypothetical protein